MTKKRVLFKTVAIGAITSAVVFSACMKSGVNNNNNSPAAGLMALNLVPDKTVSITIGGNVLPGSPLAGNAYTGVYLPIYPGNRTIESFDYYSNSSLASASDSFDLGKYYSVFVIGTTGAYQNVIVKDNFDSLTAGQAYIRYINAINGSANETVSISGSNVNNNNAAFGTVSDFTALTPGNTTITVNNGSTVAATRTITTESNKVYTVLLSPGANAGDSAQIKYIINGELNSVSGQRVSSTSHTTTIK